MNDGKEQRRSFRVNESVNIKYEVLSENEVHEGLDRRKIRLGVNDSAQSMLVDIEARLNEALYKLNAEADNVGKCVYLLNEKLNVVIDQVPTLKKEKSALATLPAQTCDVGADGLVFASERSIQVGTKLYVQFLLSTDNRFVETFAHVVRLADPPAGNNPELKYGIAIEFIGMKAAQREILIQHMFTRESETLRMRRLELDAADA